jgi:outer membrane protein OmpA-like peptidoglycan-associated protein
VIPFEVHIPHDDVIFASGKWDIRTEEQIKLSDTLVKLKAALLKHGKLIKIQLYVGGYTDTVGPPSENQTLSERRAQSIARWFRKNGIRIPIYYEGFGERVLAVPTPDNTNEARNRRAVYILSNGNPSGGAVSNAHWKTLK